MFFRELFIQFLLARSILEASRRTAFAQSDLDILISDHRSLSQEYHRTANNERNGCKQQEQTSSAAPIPMPPRPNDSPPSHHGAPP
jgi:hypothetical protein